MKPLHIRHVWLSVGLVLQLWNNQQYTTLGFAIPSSSTRPRRVAPHRLPLQLQAAKKSAATTKNKKSDALRIVKDDDDDDNDAVYATLFKDAKARLDSGDVLDPADIHTLLYACHDAEHLDSGVKMIQQSAKDAKRLKTNLRACLEWCHETTNAPLARSILSSMPNSDASDVSLFVRTICRANKTERDLYKTATSYIQQYNDLELAAYDAYLGCLSQDGFWNDSVQLLQRLQVTGTTKPGLSTYKIVLDCCLYCNQPEKAAQLLLSGARQHKLQMTQEVCEKVVVGLSRRLQWRRALQLVDLMDEQKLPKSLTLYNSLLTALQKSGESIQAKSLLQRMKRDGIQPNTLSYNAVMSACVNPRYWKDALLVFDQCLREPGVAPDIYSYTNAIRACAKGGKADRALSLLQVAEDMKLPVDAYCYTAAIDACAKVKLWKKALSLLETMERRNIAPTEVTYSVTITACGNGGNWEKSMELLHVMREKNMKVNIITYNAAIAALSKAAKSGRSQQGDVELWKSALDLLERMTNDGIEPDGFSYSSAISCCGAYGKWEEALRLFEAMQAGGTRTQPNKIAYTAAMSSCAKAGQVEQVVRLFREMKERGLAPDLVTYNSVFSAFRVSGEGQLAYDLWNEMTSQQAAPGMGTNAVPAPDFITVQEAIGAMTRAESYDNVDKVFSEAVERGIIFDADCFDTKWEVDLAKMTLSVAQAACRFILGRAADMYRNDTAIEDLVFITGVGRNHDADHPSLREYVREILAREFNLPSEVPQRASGTVVIKKEDILAWAREQCQ